MTCRDEANFEGDPPRAGGSPPRSALFWTVSKLFIRLRR